MTDVIMNAPVGTGITPEMPTEPPQEAKDLVFNMDDPSLIHKETDSVVTLDSGKVVDEAPVVVKKEEAVKPTVEAVKEEVSKPKKGVTTEKRVEKKETGLKPPTEEVVTKSVAEKPIVKPITPVKDKGSEQDAFDYTKYSPQEIMTLKNMSRQSREYTAKLIDENKQLSTLKDATYLQHEQGYTLSPDYQQIKNKVYYASTEGQCWEKALLDIKAGEKFRDITGFDDNGNPTFSEPRVATDRDEIRISQNLAMCSAATNQLHGALAKYPEQFKTRIAQDMREIQAERYNRFAWVQDPRLLEHTVEVEGHGPKTVANIKQDFKNLFPPYLANTIGVDVASDMMVAMVIQGGELREARNNQQVATIKQQEASRGEPTSDTMPAENTKLAKKGIPSVFSMEGMQ